MRATLLTWSTVFGALGIFFLYYSCMSAPVGDFAVAFLGTASGIAWLIEKFSLRRPWRARGPSNEAYFLLRWLCFRQNGRDMRHCLRFEMGGMEFANLEAETEYSVNCFTSA
jgi:hypothetical protein